MHTCNCGKVFNTKRSLNSHARFCEKYIKLTKRTTYLNETGNYVCECGKSFEKAQSINAHFSYCLIHKNGDSAIKYRGGGGWSKGLTKKNNESIAKMSKKLSLIMKGRPGVKHTEETKRSLSLKRTEFLENNSDSVKWYVVSNGEKDIKVQGKWEKDVAEWLNQSSIRWDRHKIKYDGHRTYTPDFWLPDYNFYIEVKGWLRDRDINKMKKVIFEKSIRIKILSKKEYFKLNTLKLDELIDFT